MNYKRYIKSNKNVRKSPALWTMNFELCKFPTCNLLASDWLKNNQLLSHLTHAHYRDTVPLSSLINKTLREGKFGRYLTKRMILWTCLIAAKQLSSYLTREDKPSLYLFAEPRSLYRMSQSTTIILSFHDNVWKYAHLQCRHAWSQIAT